MIERILLLVSVRSCVLDDDSKTLCRSLGSACVLVPSVSGSEQSLIVLELNR